MDAEDERSLLAWVKNERLAVLDDIDAFRAGRRVQECRPGGGDWTDITAKEFARLIKRLGRLEQHITEHGGDPQG